MASISGALTSDILANMKAISANSAQIELNCEGIGLNELDIDGLV